MPHALKNATTEGAILGGVIAHLRAQGSPPMTQQDLAHGMGLSPSAWSRVEKGETELTALQLRKVAQMLGIEAATILDLMEDMAGKLRESGISVETTTISELTSKPSTSGTTGTTLGIVVPVIGAVLVGILGAIMLAKSNNKS